MWNTISEYINNIKELWIGLDGKAKIIITAGTAVILIVLGYLIISGDAAVYTPLYTDVVSEEAGEIVNALDERNIPYKLTNGGGTIEVPKSQVYQARIDLAAEGLPNQGVVGFEIFDESQFGATDFERKVNYYRAIGGELSRSIRLMRGIDYAKVQITAPKDSIYLDEKRSASASVLIQLDTGYQTNSSQINSITNLVAGSVQDLSPGNVTVIDTAGNLLSAEGSGNNTNSQINQENLTIEKNFEQGLESDLKAMLTKVLGPDNFSVSVNAKLNFDQREVESKTYSPVVDDSGIARSEEVSEQTSEVTSQPDGGAAGTETNIPEYQAGGEDTQTSSEESTNTVTNYEINEKIERHVYAGGDIERLSVSVMVDGIEDQALLTNIQESVESAIGVDPERGDAVTVNSFDFDNSLAKEISNAKEAQESSEKTRMYIYGGLILLIIIILTAIIFMIKRSYSSSPSVPRGQMVDYQSESDYEEETQEIGRPTLSDEEKRKKQLTQELEDVVSDQPEDVAKLLKNWLLED
jgi:flagellar M-ring protein FliF